MSEQPPVEGPDTGRLTHARSLVLLHTGDGKGKTSAAMGVAVRAIARGWSVAVIQFLKSGEWRAGEQEVLGRLGVEWVTGGDGFTWDAQDLDASAAAAASSWELARATIAGGAHELVILDEITYPVTWGWIDGAEVARSIRERPAHVNVVLTGRDAAPVLLDVADTVTEMRSVRHAFEAGVAAKRGIDF